RGLVRRGGTIQGGKKLAQRPGRCHTDTANQGGFQANTPEPAESPAPERADRHGAVGAEPGEPPGGLGERKGVFAEGIDHGSPRVVVQGHSGPSERSQRFASFIFSATAAIARKRMEADASARRGTAANYFRGAFRDGISGSCFRRAYFLAAYRSACVEVRSPQPCLGPASSSWLRTSL